MEHFFSNNPRRLGMTEMQVKQTAKQIYDGNCIFFMDLSHWDLVLSELKTSYQITPDKMTLCDKDKKTMKL